MLCLECGEAEYAWCCAVSPILENLVDTVVEIEGVGSVSGARGRPCPVHVLIYFLCGVPKLKW